MQVILQEKIRNLGNIGDVVEVKNGYARNFLFREGKALTATKENVKVVETRRAELEKLEKEKVKLAKVRVGELEKLGQVELTVHSNPEGKLFGSIGAHEIVSWFADNGQEVHKSEVVIHDGPIRFVGEFILHIECYAGVHASLPLLIKSDTVIETPEVEKEAQQSESVEQAAASESAGDNAGDTLENTQQAD